MEKYSVLMSLYSKEKPEYLRLSIESILKQTVPTDEFIIVKDGEITPELNSILEEYSHRYNVFHIVGYSKNRGLAYALNFGINKCNNELIARMDSDDFSLPNRCEIQLKEFEKNPCLSLVGTDIYLFTNIMDSAHSTLVSYPCGIENIKREIRRNNAFAHPSVMFRKSDVIKCGGYDISLRRDQDHDLFSRMIYTGCQVDNLNIPLLYYRSDFNGVLRKRNKKSCKARVEIQKRLRKRKQCTLWDYIYVRCGVLAAQMLPKRIFLKIYFVMKSKKSTKAK